MRVFALAAAVSVTLAPTTAEAPAVEYERPLRGDILRHFEPPPTPFAAGHRGIDIAAAAGTTVRAAAAGVVSFAGQVGGRLFVSIDHADGLRTTYSFLDAVLVAEGESVSRGDPVARSGTGHAGSERPHLHFGVRRGDEYLDPEPLLLASIRRNLWRVVRLVPAA